MKNFLFSALFFLIVVTPDFSLSQTKPGGNSKPKLVVGIVVDQMRNDYIYRYWDRYGNGGFKRLVNNGYYFKNAHYNYIPTYTGPGHSSIYTGSTPRTHGIIGNDWFLKQSGGFMYCVQDTSVKSVGTKNKSGKMSPKNQLSSTIGDELKMSTNQNAKVFAVSLKDRSAILPAGHAADAAFWFDDETGNFISSTWYLNDLPQWLKNYNDKKMARMYLEKGWNTLYPISTYSNSITDDNKYEMAPISKATPAFPYDYKPALEKNNLGIIKASAYGNSITKDLAIECLKNERLGKDDVTDLFSISFSSTDIVAHYYGPRAIEVEDTYLRLDKDLEEILMALDKEVGANNYVVFLTGDHGGADVANHLIDHKIPAGSTLTDEKIVPRIFKFLQQNYNDTLLLATVTNEQVFLSEKRIVDLKLDKSDVETKLASFLTTIPEIAEAYTSETMKNGSFSKNDYRALLQNGFSHQLSGNVCFIYRAAFMDHGEKGTTHGAGYNYDTHVPVLFYGKGIKRGETFSYITITQIAPTVCELLQINQPNSCTSEPLNNSFK